MSEYRDGEVISMEWEDPPDEWFVAGHIPFDAATVAVQSFIDDYRSERDKEPRQYRLGECRHLWAQWVPVDEDDVQEYGFYLNTFKRKAKNRFAVTKVYDLDELDYLRKQERERGERAVAIEAMLRKAYPEILTIQTASYTAGEGWAEFTIAGIDSGVRWEEKNPFCMYVNQADHDNWRRLYQGRHT